MAGQEDQAKPISLFYSYSHRDEDLRLKLETHLSALRRGGLIAEWHDRKLEPGDAWKDEIDRTSHQRTSCCSWSAPTSSPPTTAGARR